MNWKTMKGIGLVLIAVGIAVNLKDLKRYIRMSTM